MAVIFHIFASIAEFERETNPRAGEVRSCPRPLPRNSAGTAPVEVDRTKIASLRDEGMSLRAIGKRLEISHGSVLRALRQPVTKSSDSEA